MTVVLTVNTVFAGAVVIADSRLTGYSKRGDPYPYRDVCQKLLLANGWSIVGFAGLLCPARYVMGGIVQRLRSYADAERASGARRGLGAGLPLGEQVGISNGDELSRDQACVVRDIARLSGV